jgi:hypothetical protein
VIGLCCVQVKKFTRGDMSLIRGALGTVRRLSDAFLYGERCALHAHRVRCRAVYEQCTTLERPGQLPPGVPPQCNVGDIVTARHPRLRTIHDGDVLTVSTSTYMVQFHRSELGVSKVQDNDVARSLQDPASAALKGVPGSGVVVSLGAPSAGPEEAASRGEAAPASSMQVCCFAASFLVFLSERRPHCIISCSLSAPFLKVS